MKRFTLAPLANRVACTLASCLIALLTGWLTACSFIQKSEPLPQRISETEYLALLSEQGLFPHRSPDVPQTPIPFKTVAEAKVYVEELAKFIHHQSDGQAFYKLQLRYPAPLTLAQRTSLGFSPLKSKRDIFITSKYQGYRYAVLNPNNLQEKPRLMEIIADKSNIAAIQPGDETLTRLLYASLTTGSKDVGNFTGYAFLYNDNLHQLKGKSYLNGQVFKEDVKLNRRYAGNAGSSAKNIASTPETTIANSTNGTNGCVHWIDYYASDGTYITTNCLEYADYGSDLPWGTTTGPTSPADSPGGGGGGGGGSIPLPEDPNDSNANGIGIITASYGTLPGQNAYVVIAHSDVTINTFDSGLTGYEGLAQWVHITGQQTEFYNKKFRFDIAFKVNTVTIGGYVIKYGTPHQLFGDYSTSVKSGNIYVPKYWE